MTSLKRLSAPLACVAALVSVVPAWAAGPAPLVQGAQTTITAQDMEADALRMPPEMRVLVLTRKDQVAQIASNLYVRRVMAQEAQAANMQADPTVAAALQIARDKVLSDALLTKLEKDKTPTDAQLIGLARNAYNAKPERFKVPEQVHISHILIAAKEENAEAKAEKVLADLKAGGDFAALAKTHSADPGSAAKGGDLGFFARGRMVPEFDQAAFQLKKAGDLSGLVKTQFGYHILRLEGTRPAGVRPFEEVREELMREIRNNVLQEARAAVSEKIQQGAKIDAQAIEAFAESQKAR